jgi:imidazolonepropionase
MEVDLLVHSGAQLVTCASPDRPKRGRAMADVGLIPDGAVAVEDGRIVACGPTPEVRADYSGRDTLDASDRVICPGLVDCHTHLVYAGDRVGEFDMRIRGATYMEILQAGGGILSTVKATRAATVEQLVAAARPRLDTMLALGTTTAEVKTGYGLDTRSELKMLETMAVLAGGKGILNAGSPPRGHPVELVPTFLGAHAVPAEYQGRADEYLDLVVEEMLPAVSAWYGGSPFAGGGGQMSLFCDVFCEEKVFDRFQSERVLRAGLERGLPAKIHADEFCSLGGAALAAELGAVSADHLDVTPADEIAALAASDTVGVVLPAVNFNLGSAHFADARAMIDAGMALSLATDLNPGSAPCPSLPLVMAIACRYQRLLPAEALNACTINAAHAIGLGDRIGSIEVGKQADMLILNRADYRHLAYQFGAVPVERVMKRGRLVTDVTAGCQ